MIEDEILFYGHPNIKSIHPRTIEITKAPSLSLKGDCIIGVRANKACRDLNERLKSKLKRNDCYVKTELLVHNKVYKMSGIGSSELSFLNKEDIVIRKTSFICPRTLFIKSSHSSRDLPRDMVRLLREPETKGLLRICVE
jgi:uncharacterized protein